MLNFLANHVPIILTSIALFLAIFFHYFISQKFWQPCFMVAIVSSIVAYCLILALPMALPEGMTSHGDLAENMTVFTLFSSFILAVIVGYLIKVMPDILKKL